MESWEKITSPFVFVDEKIIKEVGAKKNGSCIYKVGRQAGSEVSTFSCS